MTRYYVDFENVHSSGLAGLDKISQNEKVYIFYKSGINRICLDDVETIMSLKSRVKFVKVTSTTKNALDFMLVGKAFTTIKKNDKCVIVSCDKGYKAVFDMLKSKGAVVEMRPCIYQSEELIKRCNKLRNVEDVLISKGVKDDLLDINLLYDAFIESDNKHELYKRCMKLYGGDRGLYIYKCIRSSFEEIKEILH